MLAEKFILLLETLRSHAHDDGAPRVISTSPHIAIDVAETNPSRDRLYDRPRDSQTSRGEPARRSRATGCLVRNPHHHGLHPQAGRLRGERGTNDGITVAGNF